MSNSKTKVSKKNKTTIVKIVKKKKNKATRRNPSNAMRMSVLKPFVDLVRDPCNAPLVPGMLGDTYGLISRFRSSSFNTSTGNSGFCIWVPQYHTSGAGAGLPMNLFAYSSATGNFAPTNTTAAPLGGGAKWVLGGTGFALPDPCANFIEPNTSPAESARLVSACMRLSYTGSMSAASGQVAWLHGLDLRELLYGSAGLPPTVETLFNMASKVERLGVDTMEIKYSDYDSIDSFVDSQAPYNVGIVGAGPTTLGTGAHARAPRAFGFAWDFVEANSALKLEFVKNIEWKPRSGSGLVQPTLRDTGVNMVKPVLATLDATSPGWASAVVGVGRDVLGGKYPLVNQFVTAALTGVPSRSGLRGAYQMIA